MAHAPGGPGESEVARGALYVTYSFRLVLLMEMFFYSRARHNPEVETYVESLRFHDCAENLNRPANLLYH